MKLMDRLALVTGASRGLGRVIALALAAEGAQIVVNYVRHEAKAAEVVAQIHNLGRQAIMVKADVRRQDQVEAMTERAVEEFGQLDILINNAGVTSDALLAEMSWEDWETVLQTNLGGTFNCIKAAIPTMIMQRSGTIINISSITADIGWPGQSNYSASKGGINSLTRCAATELARFGIRVNAVAPGMLVTEMSQRARRRIGDRLLKLIPMRTFGTAEDVAQLVIFLASDESRYITGEVLNVKGGLGTGVPIS
jgi:3-oxoacyl-[acyl-carrier protein] reductase